MFYWPHLELTEYERRFVRIYKTDKYPGVLRRMYEVTLNTQETDSLNPSPAQPKLQAAVQITRRARVFGLTFSGDLSRWRLDIETASGERFTPKLDQSDGAPIVSSMVPGSVYSNLSHVGNPPPALDGDTGQWSQVSTSPLLIEPNWELLPNETLLFRGEPLADPNDDPPLVPDDLHLCIGVHVWEFPGMVVYSEGKTEDVARMGAGPKNMGAK